MKSMEISSVKMEHVEAYIYATDEHRGRPDWEDIMEKVFPMVARAFVRMDLCDGLENPKELKLLELLEENHFVEDTLVDANSELQAQILENVLKNEGIFE